MHNLKGDFMNKVYSSPYKRAVDTKREVANSFNLDIEIIDDFRERKVSNE
ncbi:histidine phosphatase family protein [Clostridium sediminicola]